MASKNIETLYNELFSMRATMEDLLTSAQNVINASNQFGGEIQRVLGEQMAKYFIPSLNNLIKDSNTPGSIQGIITFIDSCPLAYTRVEPTAEPTSPMVTKSSIENIVEPVGSADSDIADLPQGASYANPVQEEVGIVESKKSDSPRLKEEEKPVRVHDQFVITYKYTADYLSAEDKGERTTHVKAVNKEEAKKLAQRMLGEAEIVSVKPVDYSQDVLDVKVEDDTSDTSVPVEPDVAPTRELEDDYKTYEDNKESEEKEDKEEKKEDKEDLKESKLTEAEKYFVLRCSNKESTLGDISNLEDSVVAQFDSSEEAELRCESLNKTVSPEETELFGTKYIVEKREVSPETDK